MRLGSEAVPSREGPLAWGGAEVGVLDRPATEADEVVVVLGAAADIGRPTLTRQGVQRAGTAQQLEGAVGGGKAQVW